MADQGLEGSQPVDLTKHLSEIVPVPILHKNLAFVNYKPSGNVVSLTMRFVAVIMTIREPKTTALIFVSGKMVCTGAKSEQQSKLAARNDARIIQKLGFPAKFKSLLNSRFKNILSSCDVKFPIRLEGLAYSHGAFSSGFGLVWASHDFYIKNYYIEIGLCTLVLTKYLIIETDFCLRAGNGAIGDPELNGLESNFELIASYGFSVRVGFANGSLKVRTRDSL
ncbi:hypothetical protein S245_005666, partial [Arachis hypogaea]